MGRERSRSGAMSEQDHAPGARGARRSDPWDQRVAEPVRFGMQRGMQREITWLPHGALDPRREHGGSPNLPAISQVNAAFDGIRRHSSGLRGGGPIREERCACVGRGGEAMELDRGPCKINTPPPPDRRCGLLGGTAVGDLPPLDFLS